MFWELGPEDVTGKPTRICAPMPSVSGNAENTRWKRAQEGLGRKTKTAQEQCI